MCRWDRLLVSVAIDLFPKDWRDIEWARSMLIHWEISGRGSWLRGIRRSANLGSRQPNEVVILMMIPKCIKLYLDLESTSCQNNGHKKVLNLKRDTLIDRQKWRSWSNILRKRRNLDLVTISCSNLLKNCKRRGSNWLCYLRRKKQIDWLFWIRFNFRQLSSQEQATTIPE